MRARKSPGLISPAGATRLVTHAMMGAALGLAFSLALIVINPVFAALLRDGGSSSIVVFIVTLVTTFTIGATLTGVVFILAEDKET